MGSENVQIHCDSEKIILLQKNQPICSMVNTMKPTNNEFIGKLNIGSVSKLERLANLVDDDVIELEIHDNFLKCKTSTFHYKMFVDDSSRLKDFNIETLNALPTPYKFIITNDEYMRMKKNTKLVDALFKLYFFTEESNLKVALTNKDTPYSSDLTLNLSSQVDLPKNLIMPGEFLTIPHLLPNQNIPCRTDGSKILIVELDGLMYVFSTLLK